MSVVDLADWNVAAQQISAAMANVDLPDWTEGVIVSNLPAGGGGPSAAVAGLTGHWDASAITGLADGAKVGLWLDNSGGGFHLAQTTPARQPTYYSSTAGQIQNGLPAVAFVENTGLNTGQTMASTSAAVPLASPVCVQTALRMADVSAFVHQWFAHSGSFNVQENTAAWVAGDGTNTLTAGTAVTGAHVVTVYWPIGGTGVIRVDGVQVGSRTLNAVTLAAGTVTLGSDGTPANWMWGALFEVLYYSGVTLSPAQLAANETYLKAKWATP